MASSLIVVRSLLLYVAAVYPLQPKCIFFKCHADKLEQVVVNMDEMEKHADAFKDKDAVCCPFNPFMSHLLFFFSFLFDEEHIMTL